MVFGQPSGRRSWFAVLSTRLFDALRGWTVAMTPRSVSFLLVRPIRSQDSEDWIEDLGEFQTLEIIRRSRHAAIWGTDSEKESQPTLRKNSSGSQRFLGSRRLGSVPGDLNSSRGLCRSVRGRSASNVTRERRRLRRILAHRQARREGWSSGGRRDAGAGSPFYSTRLFDRS